MSSHPQTKRYFVAALLGAIGGGIVIALLTRAVPKMINKIMSDSMQNIMSRMREHGFDPAVM